MPATVVYIHIYLIQSVAFSMNSCQQFEGYQSAGDAINQVTDQPISSDGRKISGRTENSASKPLFSVLTDG